MSQNNWIRLGKLNPKILEILKAANGHLSTNDIKMKLWQKHSLKVSWQTAMKYLKQMEAAGHIEKQEIMAGKNKIIAWRIINAEL